MPDNVPSVNVPAILRAVAQAARSAARSYESAEAGASVLYNLLDAVDTAVGVLPSWERVALVLDRAALAAEGGAR